MTLWPLEVLPVSREGDITSLFTNINITGYHRDELKDEGVSDNDMLSNSGGQSSASTMQQQHQQYLGDVDIVLQNFPEIDWGTTPIPGTDVCVFVLFLYSEVLLYNTVQKLCHPIMSIHYS